MPTIETSLFIRGPREAAYAAAKRHEDLPRYAKDLESVRTLERMPDGNTVSEWVGRLQGKRMRWVERDEYDDVNFRIRYQQIEGDLKKMEGEWRFEPEGDGTRATLVVDFDLGVPMFAPVIDPIAKLVVRNNSASMLEAIRRQVEAGGGAG